MKEASQPDFTTYARNVVENAKTLGDGLIKFGHVLATGGTSNHLILWDVRPLGLTGSKVDKVLEAVSITANKNSLPGDLSAVNPGGVRLGTPALTTRGFGKKDFERVAEFLHEGCLIAQEVQQKAESAVESKLRAKDASRTSKKVLLKDFEKVLASDEAIKTRIVELKTSVENFSSGFFMPG